MHCPFKIFQKLAPDPLHVQRRNSFSFDSRDLFSPHLKWVWPKKGSNPPLCFFASNAHAQSPATYYWSKELALSRDQVSVLTPFGKLRWNRWTLSSRYILLLSPAAQKNNEFFHPLVKATVSKLFSLKAQNPWAYEPLLYFYMSGWQNSTVGLTKFDCQVIKIWLSGR
jgi:hypothetical protein